MATKTQETDKKAVPQDVKKAAATTEKGIKPLQQFLTKFNNDWDMNLSAALAYNLLMAIIPIGIAVLVILGVILGHLSPQAYTNVKEQLMHVFPGGSASGGVLDSITLQLNKSSGILSIIAVVLAIFNGSRLFILIEGCFGIIYHVRQRKVIRQNLMAIGMLILFIILIPIMVFASSLPAFAASALKNTALSGILSNGVAVTLVGIVGGLIASYILFEAIYLVVPNQHISFKHSWLGSLVAAILLQLYLTLFPLYVSHFLNGYAASISSVIILLIFFYYFAVILLFGAEVNAFFAEKITSMPADIVSMVHITTSHLPKTPEDREQQVAVSHKDRPTSGAVARKTHIDDDAPGTLAASTASTAQKGRSKDQMKRQSSEPVIAAPTVTTGHPLNNDTEQKVKGPSKVGTIIEAVMGTALAFAVELFYRRRRT